METIIRNLLIIFLFQLIETPDLYAQNHSTYLDKYWAYRNRLTTEFMVVGEQPGMSMPAERKDTSARFLKWSDNTIWLGWYIGTLALEYNLLTNPRYQDFDRGDSTALNQTLDELYHALKGIIRLDEMAESSFPLPCDSLGSIRNGFFLRDDVYSGFDSNFTGINLIRSDFSATDVYLKEMSQDQVYHLLMGLALMKKFIPPQLAVYGMNIRQEAIDQALLIVDWVNQDGWVIKNPVCQKSVDRGPDAFLLSYGINEVAKFFSDGAVNYNSDVSAFYEFAWSTLVLTANPAYSNTDNLHMAMAIAAVGKGWMDTTLNVLMDLAVSNKWYVYPLIDILLHDDTTSVMFDSFRDTINHWSDQMMDEAPPEGPFTLYPDTVTHGYAVNNRFIRPRSTHYVGHFFTEGSQFNGLDYMMLFNLYYTVSPYKWPEPPSTGIAMAEKPSIDFFPNPASTSIFFQIDFNPANRYAIKILNAVGKPVYQVDLPISELQEIDISGLPDGIYFLRVMTNGLAYKVVKFITVK